jgi:hypothetical protein
MIAVKISPDEFMKITRADGNPVKPVTLQLA